MKKIFLTVMLLSGTVLAFAQQPHKSNSKDVKQLARTEKTIHHERMKRDKEMLHGHKMAARTEKSRLAEEKERRNLEASRLKKHGVKHPVLKAEKKNLSSK